MWHPKNYLNPETIAALFLGRFTPLQVEFLGWLSYNAKALNNSRNPVKAAHTILAKIDDPDSKMARMMETFKTRKLESIKPPDVDSHEAADDAFADLHEQIQSHMDVAKIYAQGYVDYTKGGVHDGVNPREDDPGPSPEEGGIGVSVDEEEEVHE